MNFNLNTEQQDAILYAVSLLHLLTKAGMLPHRKL